jgi:hypothetical protein
VPNLAASPVVLTSSGANSNTLTTASFTPADGEVIVVKLATSDGTLVMGAPTGGSLSFGAAKVSRVPGGFAGSCAIYAVKVGTSPGSMTLASTPTGTVEHSMCVERWLNADLAGTPASGSAQGFSGAANSSLTSTGAASIVSWVSSDVQSTDPATRAYLSSAIEDGIDDSHGAANGVHYYAYQVAPSAGSQSFGMSAPTPTQWVIAGVEILDVPVTWTFGYDVTIG